MNILIFNIFDTIGAIAFAISGALTALKYRLDLFGIAVLAIVTATGGGIMRDVILGYIPPLSLRTIKYAIICGAVTLIVFFIGRIFEKYSHLILIFDAIGLGAFVCTGSELAYIVKDTNLYLVTVTATLTGAGGSVLRDILVRDLIDPPFNGKNGQQR